MKTIDRSSSSNRGVSDVVAFAISFSLIIVSVGFVYTGGYNALNGVYDTQRISSAETAMEIFGTQVEDIVYHQAPRRSLTLNLRGGSFGIIESGWIVSINGTDIPTGAASISIADSNVRYEAGGIATQWPSGTVISRSPPMKCAPGGSDRVALTVVNISSPSLSVGGSRTITVNIEPTEMKIHRGNNVTVNVSQSPHRSTWGENFEKRGWNKTGPNTYTCTASKVLVREYRIHISAQP